MSVESLAESDGLVWPCKKEVDKGDNGTFEFRAASSVDSGWRESLPYNRLANIGRNEERNTASKTIAFLEQFIEKDDNETSDDELDYEENTDSSAEVGRLAVKARKDIHDRLTKGQDDGKKLLCGLVQFAIRLQVQVDINQMGTSQKLENHARGDNGCYSQLHQSSTVTCHHHSQPI